MARRDRYIFAKKKQSQYLKEMLVIILLMIAIVLVALFLFFNLFGNAARVVLVENPKVELGSNAKASDMIVEVKKGSLKQDAVIETDRIGTTKVEVVLDQGGNDKTFSFDVEVVDTTPPVIEISDNFSVIKGGHLDLASEAKVKDNSGENIVADIAGHVDINAEGEYPITIKASDSSGNAVTKDVTVTVIDPANVEGDITYTTAKGFQAKREGGVTTIDGAVMVNKTYPVPEEYGPWDLTPETYEAYYELINAAASEKGYNLFAIDTFVSYYTQKSYYDNQVWTYGHDAAEARIARPGHSEHQTGLAIDINWTDESFGNTDEGKWLSDNCWKYGFIMRFPKGKEVETGFGYQPWHIRYVGKDLAEKLYNGGDWLTMEGYFGVSSVYAVDNSADYN